MATMEEVLETVQRLERKIDEIERQVSSKMTSGTLANMIKRIRDQVGA